MSRNRQAEVIAVLGASGSGKTSYVMQELKRLNPARLVVWDTKGEFAREGYAVAVQSISEAIRRMRSPEFRIAFQPSGDADKMKRDFALLTEACFFAKNLVLVAEELSDVTQPQHAAAGWRKCTSQGRTEGLTIYGLSQHPANLDKHFFGNCSKVRTGRLNFEAHLRTIANCLGVDKKQIANLRPLEYIERDMVAGVNVSGVLSFDVAKKPKPQNKPEAKTAKKAI